MGRVTERYLLPEHPVDSIDEYLATDIGGLGLQRAIDLGPDETTALVNRAGLRGSRRRRLPDRDQVDVRALPAGVARYAVCNGAEGEPGTFKDRALMRGEPVPGASRASLIAARRSSADAAFLAIKASFERGARARSTRAWPRCSDAGSGRRPCPSPRDRTRGVPVRRGEGAARGDRGQRSAARGGCRRTSTGCSRPTPQLGWIGGHRPGGRRPRPRRRLEPDARQQRRDPRQRPAHPRAEGPSGSAAIGTERSPGTVVCTVVGDVRHAGVDEVELGTPLRRCIDAVGGGPRPGRTIKAVISGVSNPVLTADRASTRR